MNISQPSGRAIRNSQEGDDWRAWPGPVARSGANPPGADFRGNQAGAERESNQAGDVMDFEPVHELGAMVFNGFGADIEHEADADGGLAFGDELKDLALPFGELVQRALFVGDLVEGNFLRKRSEMSRLR